MFTNFIRSTDGTGDVNGTFICFVAALLIGIFIAAIYAMGGQRSKSMVLTLGILPMLVEIIIFMVNGNVGAGVAVMGAFNLVRFRSIPGKSIDIGYIFFAMSVGITIGMGYVYFAAVITLMIGIVFFAGERLMAGKLGSRLGTGEKQLRITIPEDLDYMDCFNDIFQEYMQSVELERARTTDMGMLFELTYRVRMKHPEMEKKMIDEIRVRNGNLPIMCGNLTSEAAML